MKTIDEIELAKRWFLGGAKRAWHVGNYLDDIPSSYTIWNTSHKKVKHTFADTDAIRAQIGTQDEKGKGHGADIKKYKRRILKGEKKLPPLLVRLRADGKRVMMDGNRRCAAIMLLSDKEREGVIIPADILDEREKPY